MPSTHDVARPHPPEVVIRGGRLYWPGRPDAAGSEPLDPAASRIEVLRDTTVFVVVWLYLLLNWGFMQVRIPPVGTGGLPVGEVVLLLALVTLNYSKVLGRLSAVVWLLPFGIFWTFGVARALFDFTTEGTWALRDAAHVIESLFLLAGFAFAAYPRNLERFFVWLPRLLAVAVLYSFFYPYQFELWLLSPKVMATHGFETAIFGSMANTAYLVIMAAAYLILFRPASLVANLIAVALIGYTVTVFQARTIYLIIIGMFGFLVLYRRSSIGNISFIIYVAGILLAAIGLIGLQVEGRLGTAFSFDFLVQHFLAIFGIGSTEYESVTSAAEGVSQRLGWWQNILERMLANPFNLLLGLGYGVPLTDFYSVGGVLVREPHNSYISVFARTGVIGGICWLLMMWSLVRRWHLAILDCRALNWREAENRLMVLMVFFLCMWILALGEDGFEKPYNVIPFYFFWGVVLRFALMLEQGEARPETPRPD